MSGVPAQDFSRTNLREYSFTIDNRARKVISTVFTTSPGLAIFGGRTLEAKFGSSQLSGAGHNVVEGGHAIVFPVTLGEHAGAARSAGPWGTHNVAPDDNTRLAEANWKFYTHGLSVSTHDLRINRGQAKMASFLDHQTDQTLKALANLLGDDIYSTAALGTAITSLDSLISANDSVQGFNGSTHTNWNSRGLSTVPTAAASVSFTSGSFVARGISDMRTLRNNASEGMVQPNALLTDYPTYERYEGALQPQERFQGAVSVADASFGALAFHGTPLLPDRKCNSGYMYAVSAGSQEGIRLEVLSGADFNFGEWKPSSNQNAMVRPLELTCQMVIGNRVYGNNKMSGITD